MEKFSYYFIFLLYFTLKTVECNIIVFQSGSNEIKEEFHDLPAHFGDALPQNGLRVLAVAANPPDGCRPLQPPPSNISDHNVTPMFAVLIARYNCSFEVKVRHAQAAFYDVAIVYNVGSNDLEQMSANNDTAIFIPSVFVGEITGRIILDSYSYNQSYALIINDELPFNINTHLIIPFTIVVGLCFIIMVGFMIVKCVRERRRVLRYRLPSSVLKKIPTRKFTKGMTYDTCAICLDDYIEGEKLRLLPCSHAYHCKCIDPWLTKNRRVCPICKRKVFARGERRQPRQRRNSSSDSMSSSDADDTTPLLNPVENAESSVNVSGHGTFQQSTMAQNNDTDDDVLLDDNNITTRGPPSRFNPFDRAQVLPDDNANTQHTWQRFISFFKRSLHNSQPSDNLDGGVNEIITPDSNSTQITIHQSVATVNSNNILNSNLSGSFKNDEDDDELLGQSSSIEQYHQQRKNHSTPNLPTRSTYYDAVSNASAEASTSSNNLVDIEVGPSTSTASVIAALPNVNFNPLQKSNIRRYP